VMPDKIHMYVEEPGPESLKIYRSLHLPRIC
jgi:hypothetical protein